MDRIARPWGGRTPCDRHGEWPVRVDTHLADGVEEGDFQRWVRGASLLHSDGDAMDVAVRDGAVVGVRGRAGDRSTTAGPDRRICSAGRTAAPVTV